MNLSSSIPKLTSLPRCRASCVARFNFEFRIRLNRTIIHASSSAPDHETAKDSADSADTPSFIYKPPLSRESTDVRSSQPDFTRNFGGAVATIILGASLLAERLNGYAIVESLELRGFHPLLVITIVWLVIASIWPGKKRVDGEQQEDIVTKIQNFAPRIVYITLAVSIAAEMITEKGILALLDIETGIEAVSDVEAIFAFLTLLILTGPQSRTVK